MNDQVALFIFVGNTICFTQFYPYDSVWGVPYIGGMPKSKDLLHWEELPVTLAPSGSYDKDGCFSGVLLWKMTSSIWLYTGQTMRESGKRLSVLRCQQMALPLKSCLLIQWSMLNILRGIADIHQISIDPKSIWISKGRYATSFGLEDDQMTEVKFSYLYQVI